MSIHSSGPFGTFVWLGTSVCLQTPSMTILIKNQTNIEVNLLFLNVLSRKCSSIFGHKGLSNLLGLITSRLIFTKVSLSVKMRIFTITSQRKVSHGCMSEHRVSNLALLGNGSKMDEQHHCRGFQMDTLKEKHVKGSIIQVTANCFYITKASNSTQNSVEFDAFVT